MSTGPLTQEQIDAIEDRLPDFVDEIDEPVLIHHDERLAT